jgi:repressor of nif and glnA expression
MVTIATCDRWATKATELLNTRVIRQGRENPVVQMIRESLIQQIALADQLGAILRDNGDQLTVLKMTVRLTTLVNTTVDGCNDLAYRNGGKD